MLVAGILTVLNSLNKRASDINTCRRHDTTGPDAVDNPV